MAKFYVFIKNEKSFYNTPRSFISKNYDKDLFLELSKKFNNKVGFETVEEAESEIRKSLKKIWIYDHTKRPHLTFDYKKYRYWICNGTIPTKIRNDIGQIFENLEDCFATFDPEIKCYNFNAPAEYNCLKPTIVKRGLCDFSKEKDPSNGKFAAQVKKIKERNAELAKAWNDDIEHYIYSYVDSRNNESPLDSLSVFCDSIKDFWKNELKVPERFDFIIPANGYTWNQYYGIVKKDPSSEIGHRRGFALISSKIKFEKLFNDDKQPRAFYKSEIKIFSSKEQASVYASLNGLEPKFFPKLKELPKTYEALNSFTRILTASVMYRYMVHDGLLEANPKFVR